MITLTDKTFIPEVLQDGLPVLVEFFSPTCGPCRLLGQMLSGIEKQYEDVKFARIDVETYPDVGDAYTIMSVPTLILFNHSEVKEMITGIPSKLRVKEILDTLKDRG